MITFPLLIAVVTCLSSSALSLQGPKLSTNNSLFPNLFKTRPQLLSSSHGSRLLHRRARTNDNEIKKDDDTKVELSDSAKAFDNAVMSRYACTRFHRHAEPSSNNNNDNDNDNDNAAVPKASNSNPQVINQALQCLDLARRSPSGFNSQPYRLLVVHTPTQKERVAKYCLGRNSDRVRDSDCTVLFLADRECLRDSNRLGSFLRETASGRRRKDSTKENRWVSRKIRALILLFSSGWPLPRILSSPLSFFIRLAVSIVSVVTGRRVLVPSLGSAETWASKNTALVAMTYMLGCSSRGLQTCPMEGFNAGGMRKVLGIPRRFAIPLIVSTGIAYEREQEEEGMDDAGMVHGSPNGSSGGSAASSSATARYPMGDVIFGDGAFGEAMQFIPVL